ATGQAPIKEVMTPTNMNDTNDLG
ncbi:phage holin, partial [Staphylococcus aureus]|nr:phage holin [Staphylococcus aureus]MBS3529128.1 phage holin [Staphylococcus aureus]MBS3529130.1 phage holin [Staphylococcus aureus]MCD0918946.1 phage holin [Staphylococcus aureus]MDM5479547.1 phage holin [Staphylococcus aureus]